MGMASLTYTIPTHAHPHLDMHMHMPAHKHCIIVHLKPCVSSVAVHRYGPSPRYGPPTRHAATLPWSPTTRHGGTPWRPSCQGSDSSTVAPGVAIGNALSATIAWAGWHVWSGCVCMCGLWLCGVHSHTMLQLNNVCGVGDSLTIGVVYTALCYKDWPTLGA